MGLADRLVAQDQVREAALEMATEIAKAGPLAVQATRECIERWISSLPFALPPNESRSSRTGCARPDDYKEGVQAGFDRREPNFNAR